jgi:hypothetical protein
VNTFPPQLPGWSFGGSRLAYILASDPHSGSDALVILSDFNTGAPTSVTQSVWTVAGVHYRLEFWLRNNDIQNRPNSFSVSWGGRRRRQLHRRAGQLHGGLGQAQL